jgi:hypothetical protein
VFSSVLSELGFLFVCLAYNLFHFLITGSGDGSVYAWNVKNGKVRQIVDVCLFHMITSDTVERLYSCPYPGKFNVEGRLPSGTKALNQYIEPICIYHLLGMKDIFC